MANSSWFEEIDGEAQELATRLRQQVLTLPDPKPEALFEHVYAHPHRLIEEERREYLAYLSGFEGEH
jgi:pyruvate dehydrogenase E1 component alpha subunit